MITVSSSSRDRVEEVEEGMVDEVVVVIIITTTTTEEVEDAAVGVVTVRVGRIIIPTEEAVVDISRGIMDPSRTRIGMAEWPVDSIREVVIVEEEEGTRDNRAETTTTEAVVVVEEEEDTTTPTIRSVNIKTSRRRNRPQIGT